MKNMSTFALLVFVIVAMSGCIQTKDEYIINPDGTGKIIHEAVLQTMDLGFNPSDTQKDPEKNAKRMVREEIEKAKGIEAWRDVSWEALSENKIKFKGIAYSRNVTKVQFHNAGFSFSLLSQIHLQNENGEMVLTLTSETMSPQAKKDIPLSLDEMELKKKIDEAKEQLGKMKMMLAAGLSTMKIEKIFQLPGKRLSLRNFEITEDKKIKLILEGDKILSIFDTYMNSDEWIKDDILEGRDPIKEGPEDEDKINEILLGETGAVEAVYYDAIDPLFDYEKEVSEAKRNQPGLFDSLGVMTTTKIDPDMAGKFRLGGIRIVYESDYNNEIRPFNYDSGLTLSIIGQLPQKALSVKEGEVLAAITDNEQNLLSDKEWERKINFPNLGKNKATVIFDVNLKLPNKHAKIIKKIEGVLTYVTAKNSKIIDLGINEFIANSKGSQYNAVIESLGESEWNKESQQMNLKLDLSADKVKEIHIYDENNMPITFSKGYSSFNDEVTFNLTKSDGNFPTSGRIEIVVFEGLEQFELPFNLENITLPSQ